MVHLILTSAFLSTCIKKNKKVYLIIPFIIIFAFCALRYNYGNDYVSYSYSFFKIHNGISIFKDEPLYEFFNKIFPNFQLLIAFLSAIYLFLVYNLMKKNVDCKYWFLSVFIFLINPYVFLMSLSALRQTLATCFFLIAIHFAYTKKPLQYIVLILIAALCHKSAILLLPVYFVCNSNPMNRKKIIFIIITLLLLIFNTSIFQGIINNSLSIFSDLNYNAYASNGMVNSIRSIILTSVTFIYLLLNISKLEEKRLMYTKLYLIGIIFNILAINLSVLTRIQMYFDLFSVVAIPAIICVNKKNYEENKFLKFLNKNILPTLIIIIYILRYYSFFTNPLWSSFFEYHII